MINRPNLRTLECCAICQNRHLNLNMYEGNTYHCKLVEGWLKTPEEMVITVFGGGPTKKQQETIDKWEAHAKLYKKWLEVSRVEAYQICDNYTDEPDDDE